MKISTIKRFLQMPLVKHKRKIGLYSKIMSPEEIRDKEKEYHNKMLVANKKVQRDSEKEYMYKRDALREVLKINV